MNMVYQPPIDNVTTSVTTESTKPKTKPSLAELFQTPEVQKDYAEQNEGMPQFVRMEDVYDRPITILSFEVNQEKSKFTGQLEDFCRINFYFSDDDAHTLRQCRTQSASLIRTLNAIGNERLEEYEGVPTMILMKKDGAKTILSFDGIYA